MQKIVFLQEIAGQVYLGQDEGHQVFPCKHLDAERARDLIRSAGLEKVRQDGKLEIYLEVK
jgi:hypothetical protein